MTFKMFQLMNRCRSAEVFEKQHGVWTFDKYLLALAGETGEACNLAKKVLRGDFTLDQAREDLGRELADVICYADHVMSSLGLDTGETVLKKFREVSKRVGWAEELLDKDRA